MPIKLQRTPSVNPQMRAIQARFDAGAVPDESSPSMAALRGMTSGGGGRGSEVTMTPGGGIGNYSRGPAQSDSEIEMNRYQSQIAGAQARTATMSSEDKLKEEVARQQALGRGGIGLESEQTIQQAKTGMNDDVYKAGEIAARRSQEAYEARYGNPAQIKADADIAAERIKAGGAADVQRMKNDIAAKMQRQKLLSDLARTDTWGDKDKRAALQVEADRLWEEIQTDLRSQPPSVQSLTGAAGYQR
jgi:hypothetical protein